MTFKRFAPILVILATGCTATATGSVTPGASAMPSGSPSMAASMAPSVVPTASAAPSTAPSAAGSTAPSSEPSANPSAEVRSFEEACEHMAEGPMESKQANLVTMSRERAVVKAEHRRWDIQLVEKDGKYEGYVLFENDEAGDFAFSLGADVPFTIKQEAKDVAPEETTKTGFGCDAIKADYLAEVGIGQAELHFGPTTEKAVSLVIEHHDHEGHDHE